MIIVCGYVGAAAVRIMRQPCAMIVAMGHGRCCRRLRPSGLHLLAVAFGHGPSGGIEQSCQKAVGGSNGHGVQTGHEADSHGRERELGKGPRPAGQTAQPPVRPPGGEQCGTRSGREQDAEAAGVSVRIGIVVQEQQDEQELRVEFTGLGVACPGVASPAGKRRFLLYNAAVSTKGSAAKARCTAIHIIGSRVFHARERAVSRVPGGQYRRSPSG